MKLDAVPSPRLMGETHVGLGVWRVSHTSVGATFLAKLGGKTRFGNGRRALAVAACAFCGVPPMCGAPQLRQLPAAR